LGPKKSEKKPGKGEEEGVGLEKKRVNPEKKALTGKRLVLPENL
jgi:hypothetical protein